MGMRDELSRAGWITDRLPRPNVDLWLLFGAVIARGYFSADARCFFVVAQPVFRATSALAWQYDAEPPFVAAEIAPMDTHALARAGIAEAQ